MLRLLVGALLVPAMFAAGTTVLFDPVTPETGPFPSDALTLPDPAQRTGLRMNLQVPDCAAQYTACQEIGLLDQLDGFSVRARLHVRFSGPVNPSTLRDGLFFVALDSPTQDEPGIHKRGDHIPVNQVVYDPLTNTAYAKPDLVLDQRRRYLLMVTDAVRDTAGDAVAASDAFATCIQDINDYCASLARAMAGLDTGTAKLVAASVFTTMSATSWLERARSAMSAVPPAAGLLQPRSAFRLADLSGVVLHEQVAVNPPRFADVALPLDTTLLSGVDRVVIGSFQSPMFLAGDQTIPPDPSGSPQAALNGANQVYFNAYLPSAAKPASGYPVLIFGHGFGDSRFGGPTAVSPVMARAGFAVIAINAVGHGFGPLSTVSFIDKTGAATTVTSGGRSVDLNGDGLIAGNEGCALTTPVALGTRDCFRQTVVDLMQLVSSIRQGLDLDGDGVPDLDASRIYYAGQSLGAMYGTMLTAMEPGVRAAALNVGGASTVDIARWSPAYRGLATDAIRLRLPPLVNQGNSYNEDYVLPDQPAKVTTVPGAIAIQNVFETLEWLGTSGDPITFAPHLQVSPLPGTTARPVLIQFARGDQTVPNPMNSMLVRAAGLQSSTWMYRHDLARAKAPDLPPDPHPFLVLFVSLSGGKLQ